MSLARKTYRNRRSRQQRLARSVAVAVTALAVATAAAARTPTTASWAKAANAICATANAQIRLLPKLTTATYLGDVRATGYAASREARQLAAIPRPTTERTLIAAFIENAQTSSRMIVQQFVPAVERHDSASIARLGKRIGKLGLQFNAMARKLGARVCAENPTPSG